MWPEWKINHVVLRGIWYLSSEHTLEAKQKHRPHRTRKTQGYPNAPLDRIPHSPCQPQAEWQAATKVRRVLPSPNKPRTSMATRDFSRLLHQPLGAARGGGPVGSPEPRLVMWVQTLQEEGPPQQLVQHLQILENHQEACMPPGMGSLLPHIHPETPPRGSSDSQTKLDCPLNQLSTALLRSHKNEP